MILKAVNSSAPLNAALDYAVRKATKIEVVNLRHPGMAFEEMQIVQLYFGKSHKRTSGKKSPRYPSFHYVISLAPNEIPNVDLGKLAMEIAKEFVARCEKFKGLQIVLCLHEDRDHIHVHIIGNPVNRDTGKILHVSREEYREMIALQQQIGLEHGILPVEKGEHRIGEGVIEKQKKNEVIRRRGREADIVKVYHAMFEARDMAESWEEYAELLKSRDILIEWSPARKHVTYSYNGRKYRDSNIGRTFSDDFKKETLENEFKSRKQHREVEQCIERRERAATCRKYGPDGINNVGILPDIHREERTRERTRTRERD